MSPCAASRSALEAHHVTWRSGGGTLRKSDLSMLTAMLAVHGPGLRITIADNPGPRDSPQTWKVPRPRLRSPCIDQCTLSGSARR